MKNCNNCAWFCHVDQSCYATQARLAGIVPGVSQNPNEVCSTWSFDGLTNEEREALVTMEYAEDQRS